ncbi:uncharacterized protein I303_107387 [Kwoniella dejecticola CBS 10117]|uniref:Uncharacterized protein n=1 Tax=Kwoniella dejecticola CBS 10117 TaxID=1296121 RepID=A0A1A5ZZJ6_9TREE|nr:uncharacterized protein I303_06791 [Kwoniella dejecticola CBS 10117]OBR83230.1 hypothetical protein I303_06791 [Kwoniella dejecticola CBS 10117]
MSTIDTSTPAPLRLPAILQNPTNASQRQIESYNAQQRERIQARREARAAPRTGGESKFHGKGKRVIRRLDNAAFTSNPHIAPPLKSDYYPSVPLQARANPPTYFEGGTIPRKQSIPSTITPPKGTDNSTDSANGNFNLSLKGTRQLLRKRGGKRVEGLVGVIEKELRGWLAGENWNWSSSSTDFDNVGAGEEAGPSWRVIDATPVDNSSSTDRSTGASGANVNASPSTSGPISTSTSTSTGHVGNTNRPRRRLPPRHQITGLLPPLPRNSNSNLNDIDSDGHKHNENANGLPSILEISRSPAHLSWYVVDSFERLVIHILARYYELVSWSETHHTIDGEFIRLTHIIIPSIIKPQRIAVSNSLMTPETSELSSMSGPDSGSDSIGAVTSEDDTGSGTDTDTATERGITDEEDVEGYSLEGDTTITSLPEEFTRHLYISKDPASASASAAEHPGTPAGWASELALQRTISNTSHTSAYASSEGGGTSDYSLLDDSLVLPPKAEANIHIPPPSDGDTWSDFGSDLGDLPPVPGVFASKSKLSSSISPIPISRSQFGGIGNGNASGRRKGWEDKPTFFEYLYGA